MKFSSSDRIVKIDRKHRRNLGTWETRISSNFRMGQDS